MPQHTARIIDSAGRSGKLKIKRIREHEKAKAGTWIEGIFVFHRHLQPDERQEAPRARSLTLADRLAALPTWPASTGAHPRQLVPYGFLPYPQSNPGDCGPKWGAFEGVMCF